MNITVYQILAPLVSFVAVAYAWNLVFRQKKTIWEAVLWTAFWGAIALIALYPNAIDYLTVMTGTKNRENAVFLTFFALLFFIVFYIIARLETLEQRQTRLVRKIALRDEDSSKKEE